MRLVSALYDDFYPFDQLWPNVETVCINEPDDLQVGDVLIVWGGSDIHPSLYQHGMTSRSWAYPHGPSQRDRAEWAMMRTAKLLGVPIIGVCRGAQMLCALAGGSLVQHVDGHAGRNHLIQTTDGHFLQVNSIHHQMMNPENTNHVVIAKTPSPLTRTYNLMKAGKETNVERLFDGDPEFVYFPDVRGFAVQWHPEMMHADAEATIYVKKYIESKLKI